MKWFCVECDKFFDEVALSVTNQGKRHYCHKCGKQVFSCETLFRTFPQLRADLTDDTFPCDTCRAKFRCFTC